MMSLKELVTVLWIPAVYIMTIELSRERGERERGERGERERRERERGRREGGGFYPVTAMLSGFLATGVGGWWGESCAEEGR